MTEPAPLIRTSCNLHPKWPGTDCNRCRTVLEVNAWFHEHGRCVPEKCEFCELGEALGDRDLTCPECALPRFVEVRTPGGMAPGPGVPMWRYLSCAAGHRELLGEVPVPR